MGKRIRVKEKWRTIEKHGSWRNICKFRFSWQEVLCTQMYRNYVFVHYVKVTLVLFKCWFHCSHILIQNGIVKLIWESSIQSLYKQFLSFMPCLVNKCWSPSGWRIGWDVCQPEKEEMEERRIQISEEEGGFGVIRKESRDRSWKHTWSTKRQINNNMQISLGLDRELVRLA